MTDILTNRPIYIVRRRTKNIYKQIDTDWQAFVQPLRKRESKQIQHSPTESNKDDLFSISLSFTHFLQYSNIFIKLSLPIAENSCFKVSKWENPQKSSKNLPSNYTRASPFHFIQFSLNLALKWHFGQETKLVFWIFDFFAFQPFLAQ